jgi:hypothetical protein
MPSKAAEHKAKTIHESDRAMANATMIATNTH